MRPNQYLIGVLYRREAVRNRDYHRYGQHHGQSSLRRADYAPIGQRHAQSADQRRREQRKAQFHGKVGGRKPLYDKYAEVVNRLDVLFIQHARAAERLDYLDALDILDDGAVHVGVGLVVLFEVLAADLYRLRWLVCFSCGTNARTL